MRTRTRRKRLGAVLVTVLLLPNVRGSFVSSALVRLLPRVLGSRGLAVDGSFFYIFVMFYILYLVSSFTIGF